jgi:hypothetical protein
MVVLLDCCHAGGVPSIRLKRPGRELALKSVPAPPDLVKALTRGAGRVVLTSSQESELSIGFTGELSLWTRCLIEALEGSEYSGRDGFTRILHVADYLFDRVPALAERHGRKQHPMLKLAQDMTENFALCRSAARTKASALAAQGAPAGQAMSRSDAAGGIGVAARREGPDGDPDRVEDEITALRALRARGLVRPALLPLDLERDLTQAFPTPAGVGGVLVRAERMLRGAVPEAPFFLIGAVPMHDAYGAWTGAIIEAGRTSPQALLALLLSARALGPTQAAASLQHAIETVRRLT